MFCNSETGNTPAEQEKRAVYAMASVPRKILVMSGKGGVIIVTSPQEVSLLDSRKCVNFVHEINHKILGIVENLSGFSCPDCGREINLFKVGGGEKAALEMNVPFLGRIPIAPDMVEAGDSGKPLINESPDNPASKAIFEIADKIRKQWEANQK